MKLVVAAVLAVAALSSGSVVKPADGTFELLILHNNDMHARFEQTSQSSGVCNTVDREAGKCYGGFPRVAHVVKEARRAAKTGEGPPVLYLNAGDTYTGTAWFTLYKWKIAAEFINALKPDAVSLGNHEFDIGISGLTPFIRNLTCPVLAANLILTKEPDLQKEHNLMKSFVFNINQTKIGVIGYLTTKIKIFSVRNDVEYIDEVVAIKAEVARLKTAGVNILIALGHSGYDTDQRIAREVEDIDLVIGGHTNTFLWNGQSPDIEKIDVNIYPKMVKQKSGRSVPVVQAYAYTKYLGQLNLVFDSKGEITLIRDRNPILLNYSIPQDPEVLEIVNRYRGDVEKITSQVVGNTSIDLDGKSCRLRECNMGNMITDAMIYRYASEYKGYGWTDAPIAIIQGGGIRDSINHINSPANITKGDLFQVMPFDSNLVKITIKGVDIKRMLEHAVVKYNKIAPPGQFLQMSGLKVEYDFGRKPNDRVTKVHVRCGECLNPTYSALNYTGVYRILMPAFLSRGGSGFSMFVGLPTTSFSYDELESAVRYIESHSPMYPAVEGRIIINNYEKLEMNSACKLKLSVICFFTLFALSM